jgi:predicted deacylase
VHIAGPANYLRARDRGLFEPCVEPGESVVEGQTLGRMRVPDHPDRASDEVFSPYTGVVCTLRAMPNSEIGDCLVVIGQIVDITEFK